ncbi:peptidase S28 [Phellopilus nigrolimitatus]|nr:peptidase S28 [Phellopilus nigrolimitatus]
MHISLPCVAAFLVFGVSVIASPSSSPFFGAQTVNLWRLSRGRTTQATHFTAQEGSQVVLGNDNDYEEFPEKWFEQPLDHFSDDPRTFKQRYWVNARHYKKGGPVYVLDGGETSGEDRLHFLDTGILEILGEATNGLGVVLEHRYYGESIPVANFSTDSLRWLNNAQSAADSARFISEVKFDGIEDDLTAPGTPWIYYGGSYAGARSAHMRVLYPELVFGAIASSGVTHAAIELWEYMEVIRKAADPECSKHIETSIAAIDYVLLHTPHLRKPLKALFGLAGLEHDDDFASLLSSPLGAWQAKNWNPEVGSSEFDKFCAALAQPFGHKGANEIIVLPGQLELPVTVYNYAKYLKKNYVSKCDEASTVEECFGSYNDTKFQNTSLSETWRAWTFQVCTEWGYFITAPPDQDQPRIVSRLNTLESNSRICRQAFPPGEHVSVPSLPNITAVNVLGDFAIAADRLAIIDGEVDPWRPATPHSEYAPTRRDTILQPFKLIPDGVHHYDENGLQNMDDEPFEILNIHKEEIFFVKEWLKDWQAVQK